MERRARTGWAINHPRSNVGVCVVPHPSVTVRLSARVGYRWTNKTRKREGRRGQVHGEGRRGAVAMDVLSDLLSVVRRGAGDYSV